MASKKYDAQFAHGRSKFAIAVAMFAMLATIGTIAWLYSNPDAWLFADNSLQVRSVVKELRQTLQVLEAEIAMLRRDSCSRPRAGPVGQVVASSSSPLLTPEGEAVNPTLAKLLNKVAINREVMVVLASQKVLNTLRLMIASLQRVDIRNYIIIALDKEAAAVAEELHSPVYKRFELFQHRDLPAAVTATGTISATVSRFKFLLLRDFLVMGYSVLLSDVDIIYLQNPFSGKHLYRDSDVEGMTDGHSNKTSYGYIDEWDDPSMGKCRLVHSTRMWVFNSGLFYLRPTVAALELLDRVHTRVTAEPKLWDQDVYNEELFFPTRPGYDGLQASKRVMDYLSFMNSKTLFSIVRHDPTKFPRPVTVHINYHRTKAERMRAVVDFYVHGNSAALDSFPEGDPERRRS